MKYLFTVVVAVFVGCAVAENCIHDSVTYNKGDLIPFNDCNNCLCVGPNIQCDLKPCKEIPEDKCELNGKKYKKGSQVQFNECNQCHCVGPNLKCDIKPCTPKPEVTCEHNGQIYKVGDIPSDDCNTCECYEADGVGQVYCRRISCLRLPDPVCEVNGVIYKDGDYFMSDCNKCSCDMGEILCTLMGCGD
ncbi:kielin/chordin-like protein [Physella acuta]|uniref:kielin/chordin-like protein n=1 Tax=Physella acuta TaxID=109671 RepID=UPI0027DE2E1D|nr:kielin/chordin-like protein [Physella acuta]XP_059150366.1 kielin/chordin-like protein [Physella acuta]XP_059150367.1 kielin/chordin-like protein [Physella acuta]XP_059150368.1 kielin/chordin-like protein [Physella acuta]